MIAEAVLVIARCTMLINNYFKYTYIGLLRRESCCTTKSPIRTIVDSHSRLLRKREVHTVTLKRYYHDIWTKRNANEGGVSIDQGSKSIGLSLILQGQT